MMGILYCSVFGFAAHYYDKVSSYNVAGIGTNDVNYEFGIAFSHLTCKVKMQCSGRFSTR
jgi:hypothetical protein